MKDHPVELISSLVPSPIVTVGLLEISIAIAIVIYAAKHVAEKISSQREDSDHD